MTSLGEGGDRGSGTGDGTPTRFQDRMQEFNARVTQRFGRVAPLLSPGKVGMGAVPPSLPTPSPSPPPPKRQRRSPSQKNSLRMEVMRMMYGFGDAAVPMEDAAALVELDGGSSCPLPPVALCLSLLFFSCAAISWSARLVERLRLLLDRENITIRVRGLPTPPPPHPRACRCCIAYAHLLFHRTST